VLLLLLEGKEVDEVTNVNSCRLNKLIKRQGRASSLQTTCFCRSVAKIAGRLAYWYLHFSKLYVHYQEAVNREYNI